MTVITYKCPNCGGELVFDPKSQKYRCGYCLSEFFPQEAEQSAGLGKEQKEEGSKSDQQANPAKETAEAWAYTCPNCGAELITDATTAASFCCYCHNPVVFSGQVSGRFLPNKILPFSIDRKAAVEQFLREGKRKFFVPKDFYSKAQIEKFSGVYFPYWIYGGKFRAAYRARGNRIRIWRTGDMEYTETSVYDVERIGRIEVEGLLHNALQKTDRELVESVQPYRMDALVPFSMGYLSGFMAERRDMEKEAFEERTREQRDGMLKRALRSEAAAYDTLTGESLAAEAEKETWEYAMFPVWMVTYQGKNGKTYYYAMNGQSGRVSGEFPIVKGRLFLTAFFCGLAAFLLVLAGGYLI